MPIISDKHIINISFKHVDSYADGKERTTDVSAYLEDGVMHVRFKSGNKQVVMTVNALKEIADYITQANPSSSNGKTIESIPVAPSYVDNSSYNSLENAIFRSVDDSAPVGSATKIDSDFSFPPKTYTNPTMIAASSAVSLRSEGSDRDQSSIISKLSTNPNSESNKDRSRIRRKNALNLGVDPSLDEEGRFTIDLNEDGE